MWLCFDTAEPQKYDCLVNVRILSECLEYGSVGIRSRWFYFFWSLGHVNLCDVLACIVNAYRHSYIRWDRYTTARLDKNSKLGRLYDYMIQSSYVQLRWLRINYGAECVRNKNNGLSLISIYSEVSKNHRRKLDIVWLWRKSLRRKLSIRSVSFFLLPIVVPYNSL